MKTVLFALGLFGVNLVMGQCPEFTIDFSVMDVLCYGGTDGSITATATGETGPFSYEFRNELDELVNEDGANFANDLSAGLYEITVTDALDCDSTVTIELYSPPPLVFVEFGGNDSEPGGIGPYIYMAASGGTADYAYNWSSLDDPDFSLPNSSVGGLASGCYVGTVTDSHGCIVSDTVCVGWLNFEKNSIPDFDIRYVSSLGQIRINSTVNAQLMLYSLDGKVLLRQSVNKGENTINYTPSESALIYQIETKKGDIVSGKIAIPK